MAGGFEMNNNDMLVTFTPGKAYKRVCREDTLAERQHLRPNCYCNLLCGIEKLKKILTKSESEEFKSIPFGHLQNIGNLKLVNGQLLILLILKYIRLLLTLSLKSSLFLKLKRSKWPLRRAQPNVQSLRVRFSTLRIFPNSLLRFLRF